MSHPGPAPGGGWMPTSPCGERCLPLGADSGRVRVVCRGVALAAVLAVAVATAPVLAVLPPRSRAGWLRVACRAMLGALGIRVEISGGARRFGDGGVLVVANHLSWIEVLALAAVQPIRLIAKREVRNYPLIGRVIAATGALFIDRRGLRELPITVTGVAAALRSGDAVAVFPEGTTWCGAAAGPFRRAAFQAALDARVPVRPVAVSLRRGGEPAHEAAYVGAQDLLGSVTRVLRLPGLVCELTLLPTLPPHGDRTALARRAAAAIALTTGVPHPPTATSARECAPVPGHGYALTTSAL